MCDFPAKELIEAERKWHEYDSNHPREGSARNNNIALLCTITALAWNHEYATGCDCFKRAQKEKERADA